MKIRNTIIALAFFAMQQLKAQINFMVGYDQGFRSLEQINDQISRFNTENASVTRKMRPIWSMGGLDLGLKYRIRAVSLEGHYITRFKVSRSQQTIIDEVFKNDVKLNDQGYNFGLTFNRKKFGFGGSWENHSFRFSRKFSDDKKFIEAFDPALRYSTLNFFLDFRFRFSELVGFHIRPYYQFPLGGGDQIITSTIATNMKLNPSAIDNPTTNWRLFGVKFLFANGRQ